ncbi:unnamed protein product [Effrenium voratum]|nr:unnamed protein product [Effrenium voratum]
MLSPAPTELDSDSDAKPAEPVPVDSDSDAELVLPPQREVAAPATGRQTSLLHWAGGQSGKKPKLGSVEMRKRRKERRELAADLRAGVLPLPPPVVGYDVQVERLCSSHKVADLELFFPRAPLASQLQLMSAACVALGDPRPRAALLESPTGTGKTLALLSSVLAFQQKCFRSWQEGGGVLPPAPAIKSMRPGEELTTPVPRVVWIARTHDQLEHAVAELRRLPYRPLQSLRISRERFCLHPFVQQAIDKSAACEMATVTRNGNALGGGISGCVHLDNAEAIGYPSTATHRAKFEAGGKLAVYDIEDLVKEGHDTHTCPYHAAMDLTNEGAGIVFATYPQMLDPCVRETSSFDQVLQDSVLVIDEAHNVAQAARDCSSFRGSIVDFEHLMSKLQGLAKATAEQEAVDLASRVCAAVTRLRAPGRIASAGVCGLVRHFLSEAREVGAIEFLPWGCWASGCFWLFGMLALRLFAKEEAGYAGDVYLLFQRLDTDNSGKLTLDEIDEEAAKLWLNFKLLGNRLALGLARKTSRDRLQCGNGFNRQWCVLQFENPLDMVYKLSRGKDYLAEEDFVLRCKLFDWRGGNEHILWSGISLHGDEYVRPESLKWMAVGKEEHRQKEEMKKLAMKVLAVKIRERQMLAQVLPNFKAFLKRKCGGSLLAAWRRHLDRHGGMSVHKYELAKAVKQLCWPGEFRILWKALDKDKSGLVSYQELDMQGAEVLAEFKSFTFTNFGGAESAFQAMDKARNGSGRLSEHDFLEECQKHGFTASKPLFRGLDFHATGHITQDEIHFVDTWLCPSYLTAPKSETAAHEFKSRLKKIYQSYLKAWRSCLDKDNSNRVTWQKFQEGANRVFFHNDLPGAWRYLTAGATYLTLHDIDPDTANLISTFQAFADEHFGGMMCAFKLFDLDKNGYVDVTEFSRVLIGFGYPGGQTKALFNCLDVESHGRLSRRNVSFIDDWARAGEESIDETRMVETRSTGKASKKEVKKVPVPPRILELATPRRQQEEEWGMQTMRKHRMDKLKAEILKDKKHIDEEIAAWERASGHSPKFKEESFGWTHADPLRTLQKRKT